MQTRHGWILGLGALTLTMACTRWGLVREALPPEPASAEAPPLAPAPPPAATRETRSVVLLVIDGVRWQEVFLGVDGALARRAGAPPIEVVSAEKLLPHIYSNIVASGFAMGAPGHGAPVAATGPFFVSMPGYREIFSGSADTRCTTNDCGTIDRPTIVDQIRDASDRDEDAAVIASWDVIDRAAAARPGRAAMSTGRSCGANQGRIAGASGRCAELMAEGEKADAWPGGGGYRPDRITAPLALAYLEAARPRFLFVGLGDTDEHAHASNYRGYLGALQAADRFVGELVATLDRMGTRDTTSILITTDHGRAWNFHSHGRSEPESGRVFLLGSGGALPAAGYAEAKGGRTLSAVAPTIRGLLGLEGTEGAAEEVWAAARQQAPWRTASLQEERLRGPQGVTMLAPHGAPGPLSVDHPERTEAAADAGGAGAALPGAPGGYRKGRAA